MNNILKKFGYLLMLLSICFIIRALMKIDLDLSQFSIYRMVCVITILAAFCAANIYIGAFAWYMIFKIFFKYKVDLKETINIYVKANIAKYLPGNIVHFAGRNLYGKELGMSQSAMLISTLIEISLLIIAAIVLSIIFSIQSVRTILLFLLSDTVYLKSIF